MALRRASASLIRECGSSTSMVSATADISGLPARPF
jgi:hypothetical protein